MSLPLPKFLSNYLERLRFPSLFLIVALMFGLDLLIPDLIPLGDEIFLGIATVLLGSWKSYRSERRAKAKADKSIEASTGGAKELPPPMS